MLTGPSFGLKMGKLRCGFWLTSKLSFASSVQNESIDWQDQTFCTHWYWDRKCANFVIFQRNFGSWLTSKLRFYLIPWINMVIHLLSACAGYLAVSAMLLLTLVLLNILRSHAHFWFSADHITWSGLLLYIHILNGKQCRSRSSQHICIYTVCKGRVYPGSAGQGLNNLKELAFL